jgi:hypothetical protein
MDKLSELPPTETQLSPQENGVLKKYFDGDENNSSDSKLTWMQTFKLAIYASILFLALCNPITDSVFCRLPYCGEGVVSLLAIKTLIFMFCFVAMYKFLF